MHVYTELFGIRLPSYGLMIVSGVLLADLLAYFVIKKERKDINDFLVLEGYVLLGAFLGAKLLFLAVSFRDIDWSLMNEPAYFNFMMQSGFVFYGGVIGGLLALFLAGRLHHIKAGQYAEAVIFAIPFAHGFGRIGCFLAGCCYGIPYEGVCAVTFPASSFAPAGISLFPVQLVEAFFLFLMAFTLLLLRLCKHIDYTLELYLIAYAVLRFALEGYRYDEARGIYAGLSTSQWISLLMLAAGGMTLLYRKRLAVRHVKGY